MDDDGSVDWESHQDSSSHKFRQTMEGSEPLAIGMSHLFNS